MHATLVPIGNSQGIRIPRAIIEQIGLRKDLDLEVRDGALIVRPMHGTRAGWADAAAQCHAAGEDTLANWDATTADFAGDWQ